MSHDYDHGEDRINEKDLKSILSHTLEMENALLRTYAIAAEGVQNDRELQDRLHNLAEGNAKRIGQLEYEIEKL